MDPFEGTSFVGLMSTDLNSEFTHFELVIRLSKVQQLALRFSAVLRCPAAPDVPGYLAKILACQSEAVLNVTNLRFCSTFCNFIATIQALGIRQAHDLQVWSFSF